MTTVRPTATGSNPSCQFVIDLTNDQMILTTTSEGGSAALFSRLVLVEARAGRRSLRS